MLIAVSIAFICLKNNIRKNTAKMQHWICFDFLFFFQADKKTEQKSWRVLLKKITADLNIIEIVAPLLL